MSLIIQGRISYSLQHHCVYAFFKTIFIVLISLSLSYLQYPGRQTTFLDDQIFTEQRNISFVTYLNLYVQVLLTAHLSRYSVHVYHQVQVCNQLEKKQSEITDIIYFYNTISHNFN